jgi:DNA replication licensing factor MCM7
MRQQDGRGANSELGDQAAMTARALLSILRLSQALAKLRFSDAVAVSVCSAHAA